jgi:hypothetical protein
MWLQESVMEEESRYGLTGADTKATGKGTKPMGEADSSMLMVTCMKATG